MKTFLCPMGLVATLLFTSGVAGAAESQTNATKPSCCSLNRTTNPVSSKSIYQVESAWTSDQQEQIKLSALGGRPQVLVMFFAQCQFACPILVNDMKVIEAALPAEVRARVRFTLVSFDSKRDTPAALAEYRRTRALPKENWTLLCGKADDVLELAALLGLKFKQDANGQFAHSNIITILNAQGEIVRQETGLNQDLRQTISLLRELAATNQHASSE